MIENARRQTYLVAAIAAMAALLLITREFRWGLDLRGGTQLIYEIDVETAKQQGLVDKDADPNDIIQEQLIIIGERIDPTGTLDAVIQRHGGQQFLIELPLVEKAEAEVIKSQIQNLGRLEMRIVEDGTYDKDGVTFDMAEEKKRLEEWLGKDDNRNRLAVAPEEIRRFNALSTEGGGRVSKSLQWYPAQRFPDFKEPTRWQARLSQIPEYAPAPWIVDVFDDTAYTSGPPTGWEADEKPFLVEILPINMAEVHFTGEDMDASGVRKGNDPDSGTPCVFYKLRPDKTDAYADWSDEYKNKASAIILNGVVRSAPTFRGRIYGQGLITGGFTDLEAASLTKVIKTGSLKVKPTLISDKTIGETLGKQSIRRGAISIGAGGILVLMFILAYYRMAGLVAFGAIALNVFLILATVLFIRATITLPGIAGLVLTMGMAVDANILIYERIREELARGKELLQGVRAGFDRAMVTIFDANVTTFIAGVVLYNVGVGPVRGFAVTLMIGILTSLFTAFFVSRLAFHYLMAANVLKDLHAAQWFSNLRFDFVRASKVAFTASVIVVVLGLGNFFRLPNDTKLGLDFTGGASLELSTSKPVTATTLRERLAADTAFKAEFPDPIINTLGERDDQNQATEFSVKLKLTDALRAEIADAKKAARDKGESYEPPYKEQLRTILSDILVENAFSNIATIPTPDGQLASAYVEVHYLTEVDLAEVRSRVEQRYGAEKSRVTPIGGAPETTTAKDLAIEFPVPVATTAKDVEEQVIGTLKDLENTAGEKLKLSNPIPNAEDIGPRMVGELKTAAIGAMVLALFLIVMYIRLRFHEYKYSIGAVAALLHDVFVTMGVVAFFNAMGLVSAEIDLAMIAAFLTIIGYSINDTIVIFDRVRENVSDQARLGDSKETFAELLNRSINQTLSRTILTSGTTLFVVLAQFAVNYRSGSALEGFSFALIIGILCGTYSTMFIATPVVLWLRKREDGDGGPAGGKTGSTGTRPLATAQAS